VRITDAQVHLMTVGGVHGRTASAVHRMTELTAGQLRKRMAAAGVARAVLVPHSSDGSDATLRAARRWPTQFGVMGKLPIGERTAENAARWRAAPGMLGIRLTVATPQEHVWLACHRQARSFWAACARHDVPVMVYAPHALGHVAAVAGEHPRLRLIVDHAGLPLGLRSQDLRLALQAVQRLRDLPNVALKVSALPCYCTDNFPFRSLRAAWDMLLDDFGAHRLMWGSDLTRLPCPYAHWVDAVTGLPSVSGADKACLLDRSLTHWLSWP
jgi:L-fuconolactonase